MSYPLSSALWLTSEFIKSVRGFPALIDNCNVDQHTDHASNQPTKSTWPLQSSVYLLTSIKMYLLHLQLFFWELFPRFP